MRVLHAVDNDGGDGGDDDADNDDHGGNDDAHDDDEDDEDADDDENNDDVAMIGLICTKQVLPNSLNGFSIYSKMQSSLFA